MNLDRFDLNLLVAFEALMTEGQVTRAARRLHITQPALSGALARLRTVFDDQLFVKDGKSMRPTLRARELDAPIREALDRVRQAIGRPSYRPRRQADAFGPHGLPDVDVGVTGHEHIWAGHLSGDRADRDQR